MSKDKIFYRFIIKYFREQLHEYFIARIPTKRYGPGCKVPLGKSVIAEGSHTMDKNGVLKGKTTTKYYIKGWNDCAKEMKTRVL